MTYWSSSGSLFKTYALFYYLLVLRHVSAWFIGHLQGVFLRHMHFLLSFSSPTCFGMVYWSSSGSLFKTYALFYYLLVFRHVSAWFIDHLQGVFLRHMHFYYLLVLRHVSAWLIGHLQGVFLRHMHFLLSFSSPTCFGMTYWLSSGSLFKTCPFLLSFRCPTCFDLIYWSS